MPEEIQAEFTFSDVLPKYEQDVLALLQQKYRQGEFYDQTFSMSKAIIEQPEIGCVATLDDQPVLLTTAISLQLSVDFEFVHHMLQFFPAPLSLLRQSQVFLLETTRAINLPMDAVMASYQSLVTDFEWTQSAQYDSVTNRAFFHPDYIWMICGVRTGKGQTMHLESLQQIEMADFVEKAKYQRVFHKAIDDKGGILSFLIGYGDFCKLVRKLM